MRNALTVPADELRGLGRLLLVSESQWGGRNNFTAPIATSTRRVAAADGLTVGCVAVGERSGSLEIRYHYDQSIGGAPDRWFLNWPSEVGGSPGRSLTVAPGQWVRVCYNGRFSDLYSGNWWYEQVTVNVAWFGGDPDGRVFFNSQPTGELMALAALR